MSENESGSGNLDTVIIDTLTELRNAERLLNEFLHASKAESVMFLAPSPSLHHAIDAARNALDTVGGRLRTMRIE